MAIIRQKCPTCGDLDCLIDHAEEAYANRHEAYGNGCTPAPTNTAKATSFKLELARVAEQIEVKCAPHLPSYLGAYHARELAEGRKDAPLALALQRGFVTLASASYEKTVTLSYRQARELAVALRTIGKTLGDSIEFGEDCPISINDTCEELYWAIADACLAEPVKEEDIIPDPNLPFKYGDERDKTHPGNKWNRPDTDIYGLD